MENRAKIIDFEFESTVTVSKFDESNKKLFLDSLASLDPNLWIIKSYLDRYNVSPLLIPVYIEHLAKINEGSGYGKILTEIRDHKVVFCEGTDSRLLDINIEADYNYNNQFDSGGTERKKP